MATGNDPLRREQVQVSAQDPQARLAAPQTNQALQLAESLRDITPEARRLMQGVAENRAHEEKARAAKDALEQNGAKLADAVREGKIRPTQNPWYVQAYNTESAAVRAQAALGKLQEESLTWDNQDDPQAFRKQWQESLAEVSKQFEGTDAITGFQPVANQVSQQVLATNTAKNAQRIERERVTNLGALGADALSTSLRANGGNLSAEQAYASIEPARTQWFATGGDQTGWDDLVKDMVTSAAEKATDPNMIDLLKDPKLRGNKDGPSIYDMPGVAKEAEQLKYYIQQRAEQEPLNRLQQVTNQRKARASEALDALYTAHGTNLLTGNFSRNGLIQELTGKGYNAQEIAMVFDQLRNQVSDSAGLEEAAMSARIGPHLPEWAGGGGGGGSSSPVIFSLGVSAAKEGYSPEFEAEVEQAVLAGTIKPAAGASLVSRAMATSRRLNKEPGKGGKGVTSVAGLKNEAGNLTALVSMKARQHPKARADRRYQDDDWKKQFEGRITGYMRSYLALHPGDYNGALKVGRTVVATQLQLFNGAPKPKAGQ